MQRRPPRTTRTDTLFPDTTLFRSHRASVQYAGAWPRGVQVQRLCASRRAPVAPRDPGRNAPDHMDLAAQLTGEIIASSRWEPDPQESVFTLLGFARDKWTSGSGVVSKNGRASCRERGCQ